MAIQIRTSLDEIDTGDAYVPHRPARPDKVEGGKRFELVSDYQPAGDQPTAIRELVDTALDGEREAGEDRLAVDEDRAGAALAQLAAVLGPGQRHVLAQHLEEGAVDRDGDLAALPVHRQGHEGPHDAPLKPGIQSR